MKNHKDRERWATRASRLESLIEREESEESIHQYIKKHPQILGSPGRVGPGRMILEGMASKFPVAPDRIPDFVRLCMPLTFTQSPTDITFFELKRPSSKLFVGKGRFAEDLNEAWRQCLDTQAIMAHSYREVLRRLINTIDSSYIAKGKAFMARAKKHALRFDTDRINSLPQCRYVILIGRRALLDSDGVFRLRQIEASSGGSICVYTYDHVLDQIREAAQGMHPGWFRF